MKEDNETKWEDKKGPIMNEWDFFLERHFLKDMETFNVIIGEENRKKRQKNSVYCHKSCKILLFIVYLY